MPWIPLYFTPTKTRLQFNMSMFPKQCVKIEGNKYMMRKKCRRQTWAPPWWKFGGQVLYTGFQNYTIYHPPHQIGVMFKLPADHAFQSTIGGFNIVTNKFNYIFYVMIYMTYIYPYLLIQELNCCPLVWFKTHFTCCDYAILYMHYPCCMWESRRNGGSWCVSENQLKIY